jgi:hypothetical protein
MCISLQNINAVIWFVVGEKLDLERSETLPLTEKGIRQYEVTIENESSSIDDLNPYFSKSKESPVNECVGDKEY